MADVYPLEDKQPPRSNRATLPDIDAFVSRIKSGRRGSDNLYVLLLGTKVLETPSLKGKIEQGFVYGWLEHLRKNMTLSIGEIAEITQISSRTLNRRRKTGRLQPAESDRVLRVARIFGRALELFEGDYEGARRWFMSPQRALANETPANHAKTEFGALEVERLIGRLEHGVFT